MPAIDYHALVTVGLVFALGVMSPGPNFLIVAQRSIARGRADGLATMLGVVTVSGLWAAGSLFGIGIVFALFPWTRVVLRVAGAAYLFWLGVRMWRNAQVPLEHHPIKCGRPRIKMPDKTKSLSTLRASIGTQSAPATAPDAARTGGDFWSAYRAGLATNLSNAKSAAFYTSAFSAAAPAPGRTATLWIALALVLVIALAWYGLVAVGLSSGPVAAAYRRGKVLIERVCGALMIGFGVKLAVE